MALSSRNLLPRSLFGRALTILLVPIVALQLVVGLVFFQRHYQRVTEQMTRNVAYELEYAVEAEDAMTPEDFLLRRTKLHLLLDDAGRGAIRQWFAKAC